MKGSLFTLIVIFLFVSAAETFSLPRFSLRMGGTCMDCHSNPTGGIIRNDGGWSFGKNVLALVSPREENVKLSNRIGENIRFGFDLRAQYLMKQTDSTTQTDFQRMAASLYADVDFSDDINAITRFDYLNAIWEGYVVARILPNNSYVKAGVFTPNFGIRTDDHTAYTRGGDLGVLFATGRDQGLIYVPTYLETGLELGAYISDIALLTASVGNPRNQLFVTDPTYTTSLQFFPMVSDNFNLFFGGSFVNLKKRRITTGSYENVNMMGGFAGFGFRGFTLMGEYVIANDFIVNDQKSTALMVEAAYRLMKGLEAIARLDRFDPSDKAAKDEFTRIVFGFEFFPYSFIEIRPQYRIQMEEPKIKNDSFVLQFHFYY